MNNIIINGITAVCLIALVVQAVVWFVMLFCRGRTKDIEFLESFKKGQFAIVYVTAIPLYVIGFMYGGKDFINAFFNSVSKIIELVVLKYDFECIEPLMDANSFYKVTVFICFAMAGLNIVFVALSVLSRRIWEFSRRNKIRYCPKDRLFIFGSNPQNREIYESEKKRTKTIIDKISDDERDNYYLNDISYIEMSDDEMVVEIFKCRKPAVVLLKLCKILKLKISERTDTVVINTGSDERNMLICRKIIGEINNKSEGDREKIFRTLRAFTFGEAKYEAIYDDIESAGFGCITYLNKYKTIGFDFAQRYPLASFMDERHIDYDTFLVRRETDINFFMICFGKVSRQIFLTSVANNQFLTEGENGPELKKVKYHIFDRDILNNNKNLNHNYYRFRDEVNAEDKDKYLPLPSLPAEEEYHHLDINDGKLYSVLKKCVCRSKNDLNFVLVSFGDDLENIDMAQKLVAKRREWGAENLVIFVRTRTRTKEQEVLEKEGCLFIGNETEIVYNIGTILSDVRKMAITTSETYDLEYALCTLPLEIITDDFVESEKNKSLKRWYTHTHRLMRESNIYAALSIRAKLNMMGLDYCRVDANDEPAVTEKEYLAIYAASDMPRYTGENTAAGRKVIEYGIDFAESGRRNLAILEHYRWNSYMITRGFVPATIEQIMNEKDENGKHTNGKSYVLRRHGNLTTFEGLELYRKMVAQRDRKSEKDMDVIKYDYQMLDDLYYILTISGNKIIKKRKN